MCGVVVLHNVFKIKQKENDIVTLQKEAEILRARGFMESSEEQPYFALQESRCDALARIRAALLKDGVLVDCVVLEVEFTPLGVCTLWPGELKYENGMYRLFGILYGQLMDCHGRVLYRLSLQNRVHNCRSLYIHMTR